MNTRAKSTREDRLSRSKRGLDEILKNKAQISENRIRRAMLDGVVAEVALLKARLMALGLYQSGHEMERVTICIGFELEGMDPRKIREYIERRCGGV